MPDNKISQAVRGFLKSKKIPHKEVAEVIGFETTQSFENALTRGVFSKKASKKMSQVYGFSERFLRNGEGELFEKQGPTPAHGTTPPPFPSKKDMRLRAWEKSGGRCCYCRRPLALDEITIEHISPQSKCNSKQNADTDGNIIACCSKCNTAKGDMSVHEFAQSINTKNQSLLQIEAERKTLLAKVSSLNQAIESKRFAYIRYLRDKQGDDSLQVFFENLKQFERN